MFVFISFFIGLAIVGQSGLNRIVADKHGLTGAVFINSVSVLLLSIIMLAMFRLPAIESHLPSILKHKEVFKGLKLWYLFPGFLGLCIVTGVPFGFARWGAMNMIIGLISSQVIGSMLWDYFILKVPISGQKIIAAILAVASMILSAL